MPDQRLPQGSILRERYEIGERLGHNRASTTYVAVDLVCGSPCVVKELSVGEVVRGASGVESYDPEDFTKLIELFEREARILANLDHPGVPRLIEHFSLETDTDTRLYTVQEHIDGKTLASLVASGRHFCEEEVVAVSRDVANILSHLHGLSPPLIHRDIKPSNVMLDDDGAVHLIDFGAVKNVMVADEQDGKTIVGTFGYMPMEQYEARALPASDIYALGGTLVFLLSHLEPHRIGRRGMTLDFRPHVNVSEGFSRVIEKMIEPNWEQRYQGADELQRDLAQLGRGHLERRPAPRGWGVKVAAALFAVLGAGIVAPFLFVEADAPEASISREDTSRGEDTSPEEHALAPIEPSETGLLPPIVAVDGVLVVDIYDHFKYVAQGWPMGRSVGQTSLPALTPGPTESLTVPRNLDMRRTDLLFGFLPLGNGADSRISFILSEEGGDWALFVDKNNNEDMTDDGPPLSNQGSGTVMAASLSVSVEIQRGRGVSLVRPYELWVWFRGIDDDRGIRGLFYGRNHYAGSVSIDGRVYEASAFELRGHDGLYRDDGLCIDLDQNGECHEEREIFFDGEVVTSPEAPVRLELRYP